MKCSYLERTSLFHIEREAGSKKRRRCNLSEECRGHFLVRGTPSNTSARFNFATPRGWFPSNDNTSQVPNSFVCIYTACLNPLVIRSSKERESGDYASSDVQSVSSRLSTLSMDTSRSELFEMNNMISPQYYTPLESNKRNFRFVLAINYFSTEHTTSLKYQEKSQLSQKRGRVITESQFRLRRPRGVQ